MSASSPTNPADRRAGIDGVVPVLLTPFRPDSELIDWDALEREIEFAASLDIAALCVPAYGSEFYKLSEAERGELVARVVRLAAGRVRIMAQSNHAGAVIAADIARRNADSGADIISFALPRVFGTTSDDLLAYATTICQAVDLPVLIQDWNPGGPTVDGDFCRRLHERCPNFRFVKLEEPLMAPKVLAIREATADRVGVLEGWGGMFMLELIPAGICGLMPGIASADLLATVWRLGQAGQLDEAFAIFEMVLPQLTFGLNNMELFMLLEKQLLVARGVLPTATMRRSTYTPPALIQAYGDVVNGRILAALDRFGLPRSPAATAAR